LGADASKHTLAAEDIKAAGQESKKKDLILHGTFVLDQGNGGKRSEEGGKKEEGKKKKKKKN
jgi:hypothetical protein